MDDIAAGLYKMLLVGAGSLLFAVTAAALVMVGATPALPKVRRRGRRHVFAVEVCWFTIAVTAFNAAAVLMSIEGL